MNVFVYRNLHKNCWSVKSLDTGRVIFRPHSLMMIDGQFKVSQAGRQRVLKEKRKNVHAGVKGELLVDIRLAESFMGLYRTGHRVTYNPYKYETFVKITDETPVSTAECLYFTPLGHVYASGLAA